MSESGGCLASLVPHSTRPKRVKTPQTKAEIVEFIKSKGKKYHRIGKEKLKVMLNVYCKEKGIPTVSTSTIGNIIKRNNFFQRARKTYHDLSSKWAQKASKKAKRLRVKYSPKPSDFGFIVSESVECITDRIKDYFISAVDAKGKFALTLNYKKLTSANMKDFYT